MAEGAAVGYLLRKLADPLLEKALEMYHVSEDMEQMQKDLSTIHAYLKDVDSMRTKNELVKDWVNQVREIAYRMEDTIDTFLVEVEEKSSKRSRWWSKLMRVIKKPYKMYNLGGELKDIRKKLTEISQFQSNLRTVDPGAGSEQNAHLTFRRTETSLHADDLDIVGLEADKCEIINQLLDRNISRRMVLSIVGPGGLGKTTLAQEVYKSAKLQQGFDCRTWLTISQKFKLNDLLRKLLYSIEPRMRQQNPPVEDLSVELIRSLSGKSYLIILDDVWTMELWDKLKEVLPDSNNASRVIVTSRLLFVAKAADCNTQPYELRYLNDDDSRDLLFRKAFQQDMQREEHPTHLLKVAKKLAKKCGGLPLALVVLGFILSKKERTHYAWSKLETMDWHNDDGKNCSQVLALSIKELPYDLKPCFLYFASFPKDHSISGKHVTRMWLAEGFIPFPQNGEGTIEDRAEQFLEGLVQRYLIQVNEKTWNDYCKTCSMHDILRDMVIHQAMEENFFTVFPQENYSYQLPAGKPIRASMQFSTFTKDGIHSKKTRSLLCFGFGENSTNYIGFTLQNYSGFRLLRVLTIDRVDMRNFHCGNWLKSLMHLKHLGFRYCTIGPTIFKKKCFPNLEIMDLKGTAIDHSNNRKPTNWSRNVIPTLRHLYGCHFLEEILPLKWDYLTNLQTLKIVGHREIHMLGCSTKKLRTLGIRYQPELPHINYLKEWQTLKRMLENTEQLISLSIAIHGDTLPFGGTVGLPCHEKIQSLHLEGHWGRIIRDPSVEFFPINLTKLTLEGSCFWKDPMPIVERLQSLMILRLWQNSYEGITVNCRSGGFPNLKKLELVELPNLQIWIIEEGAMPMLSHLKIKHCVRLNELPELQQVPTLQKLLVDEPSPKLQERMQGEDLPKIAHIPFVLTSSNYSDLAGQL